mmetsp:Transcript_51965/g.122004  ORF Transcript_51965/g.122004 Transcript_51965/m.122004 type:complete len:219 (-) Transcript_51965:259-915(-)
MSEGCGATAPVAGVGGADCAGVCTSLSSWAGGSSGGGVGGAESGSARPSSGGWPGGGTYPRASSGWDARAEASRAGVEGGIGVSRGVRPGVVTWEPSLPAGGPNSPGSAWPGMREAAPKPEAEEGAGALLTRTPPPEICEDMDVAVLGRVRKVLTTLDTMSPMSEDTAELISRSSSRPCSVGMLDAADPAPDLRGIESTCITRSVMLDMTSSTTPCRL